MSYSETRVSRWRRQRNLSKVDEVHAVLTDYGQFGWGLTSPQLPGLVGGAATLEELDDNLFETLVGAGMDRKNGSVYEYEQRVFEIDDDVFIVRVKRDGIEQERKRVAMDAVRHLEEYSDLRGNAAKNDLDDAIVIATVGNDRVSDVLKSLRVGEPATLAMDDPESPREHTVYTGVINGGTRPEGALTGADLGLGADATVRDLFEVLAARHAERSEQAVQRELVLVG